MFQIVRKVSAQVVKTLPREANTGDLVVFDGRLWAWVWHQWIELNERAADGEQERQTVAAPPPA